MTTEELATIAARYTRAAVAAENARQDRNHAVEAALAGGMTQAAVARATGLTRGRVGQMAQRINERKGE